VRLVWEEDAYTVSLVWEEETLIVTLVWEEEATGLVFGKKFRS